MTLSESERIILAHEYLSTWYPTATPQQVDRVVNIVTYGFSGNLSPITEEQDEPGATGTGASFEDFVIWVAHNVTGNWPPDFDTQRIGTIIYEVGM